MILGVCSRELRDEQRVGMETGQRDELTNVDEMTDQSEHLLLEFSRFHLDLFPRRVCVVLALRIVSCPLLLVFTVLLYHFTAAALQQASKSNKRSSAVSLMVWQFRKKALVTRIRVWSCKIQHGM